MTDAKLNRRYVLARRPVGVPRAEDFRIEMAPIPTPGPDEMLVRNVYIPVDPGMRPALSERWSPLPGYEPVELGAVVGYLTVGQVVQSNLPDYAPGDWVTDYLLWQDYAVADGRTARRIRDFQLPPSTAVGILGVPGLSAYFGLLGFHGVVDRTGVDDLSNAIRAACPDGVDVLFDNVGNAMIDRVLPLMQRGGRIVICGQIADYATPYDERDGIRNTSCFAFQRLTMKGLYVHDFASGFDAAIAEMTDWILAGRLKYREHIEHGFARLPEAFADLFRSGNLGRPIVKIA